MKVIVAGSRDFNDYVTAKAFIDNCLSEYATSDFVFISGECRGADRIGERYAKENGFRIERFPAEWNKFGRAAGPIRNKRMAEACDILICFWDGESRGTASVIDFCKKKNKKIFIKFI